MRIFIPRETDDAEKRVPVLPVTVARLVKLGFPVSVESDLGRSLYVTDEEYIAAGATVTDRSQGFAAAEMILRLRKPSLEEVPLLPKGCLHVSYLDPFNEFELIRALAAAGVSAVSLEMIPRSSVAQKMDALSSQANIAGYNAVIMAAYHLGKIFPMMMTPSGTIAPAKVFVIGVGIAGLQAIATAKRLGATVEAFDTRPAVEEQVKSLGARFVKVDLGEMGQTAQGYAKELTPEQIEKQRAAMADRCAQADVVITTAQVFGRKAPRIVTTAMVERMKPGSVVLDMAVETGGNVEGSRVDEIVVLGGVKILGPSNLAAHSARAASEMFSNNLGNFVEHFWDNTEKKFLLNPQNDLLKGCLITHAGSVVNETIKKLVA